MDTPNWDAAADGSVTVAELDAMGAKLFEQRRIYEAAGQVKKTEGEKLEALEQQMLNLLERVGHKSHDVPGMGKAISVDKFSVKMPSDPDARSQFFGFLKSEGIFEDMITVHSARLNSFYDERFEAAKAAHATDFKIPGIEPGAHYKTISLRKG